MDVRWSAGPAWRSAVLAALVPVLAACAAELAEIPPTPAAPVAAAPEAPLPVVAKVTEEPAPPPAPPKEEPAAPPAAAAPPAEAAVPAPAPPAAEPPAASPPPAATEAAPAPPPAPPAVAPPAPVAAPAAPVSITGVQVDDMPGGGLLLQISADGPLGAYESFTLPDPARLVLDIPNATHAVSQPISARPPLVTAVRSSQYRERPVKVVRVVVDLRSLLPYQVAATERQLRVQLGAAGPAPAPPAAAATAAGPAKAAEVQPVPKVTRVDVQNVRGRQRIVIGTSGSVRYRLEESAEPLALTLDVAGALIEPAASRTLDLRQVSSPILRVRASQLRGEPDRVVRIAADLKSRVRPEVQQTASAIVVELLPVPAPAAAAAAADAPAVATTAPAPAAPAPTPRAAATPALATPALAPPPAPPAALPPPGGNGLGRLSMDFKEADINNLLRIIAEVSGMNVVAGDDVRGKVTVRLVNVDWQQALDVILKINGMGYEIDGNILRVASLKKLADEQKARDDAKKREEDLRAAAAKAKVEEKKLEPLVTEVVAVNYAKAGEVVRQLDRLKTAGRTDVSLVVDDRTNKLIIQETAATLDKMRSLLKELDRATPQVLIEARLVEATRTFSQSLGIEWGFAANANLANLQSPTPVSIFSSQVGTSLVFPTAGPGVGLPLAVALPATSPTAAVGIIANELFSNKLALGARISAGEAEGKVRTLSAPRVATLDNKQAEIKQGQQVPYTTIDSSGRTVVAFLDAFIRLKVTPHITNDRRISMEVEAERSFPGDRVDFAGGFVFPINTRKAQTNILVSNGSTVVIGGLMQSDERVSETRVPWLHRVPVLGQLFKSTSLGPEGKVELLIFLTPTILEETPVS
ncbi:MAG: type IV pilus secretin PilQ [Candidatus Methylomirabilales bacterium]